MILNTLFIASISEFIRNFAINIGRTRADKDQSI